MLKSSGTWLELIPYFRNSFSFKFYDFGNPTYWTLFVQKMYCT